jgi:hypothetical protein
MMSHSRDCRRLTPQQCESCHYRQNFLDTPICLARVNCIFDVPHGPGLAFSQAIFRMPTFLAGPALGRGGTILDEGAQSKPAFAFLGFLCHLGLPFLICRLRGHGARLWTGKVRHPIYSRTQFKRPSFVIFATLRALYCLGPKLPSTLFASVSTSIKK